MPVTTYTLAGDFNALIGDVKNLSATIHLNTEDGSWINEADDIVILGGAQIVSSRAYAPTTGAFSIALPTSTGTGLQYEVRASYRDPSDDSTIKSWRSGWFDLTANANLADKANDSSLRVNPSLGAQLAARIDGYVDHGNVSGAVTIDPSIGTHVLDATATTTLTLDSAPDGRVVSILAVSGAENVAVNGLADAELADGAFSTFVHVRGGWMVAASGGGGGGSVPTPDTTPPSAVTGLTATPGDDGHSVALSWTAATDAESPVRYRARIYTTGSTAPAWPTSGPLYGLTTTNVTATGLTGGTAYTVEVHAYSNGGSGTADSETFSTPAALSTVFTDTFTGTGNLSTHTADTGQSWAGSTAGTSLTANRLTTATGNVRSTHGSQCREATFDVYFTASDLVQLFPWDGDTGSNGGSGPRGFINQNGQVSLNGITVTYNASGGTENYTPSGYVTIALNTSVPVKMTYDGTLVALHINGTKIIEGAPTSALSGTKVAVNTGASAYIDNLNIKAIA